MKYFRGLLLVIGLLLLSKFIRSLGPPRDHEACVTKYVSPVPSGSMVYILDRACKSKFKEKKDLNYADYILDSVPDAKADQAARVLDRGCREKFPLPQNPTCLPALLSHL